MQHIKHFRAKKIVKINEGPDEARSGYAELVLPLYSNSGSTLGNQSNFMQGTVGTRTKSKGSKGSAEVQSTDQSFKTARDKFRHERVFSFQEDITHNRNLDNMLTETNNHASERNNQSMF